jgi:hypothetical protein
LARRIGALCAVRSAEVLVAEAVVEVLAQCGHAASALANIGAHHRDRCGEHFWLSQLGITVLRYHHPRLYGPSPSEADASRLARRNVPTAGPLASSA